MTNSSNKLRHWRVSQCINSCAVAAVVAAGYWLAPPLVHAQVDRPSARFALIIGNDTYTAAPLSTAISDARRMAVAADAVGFRVRRLENAGKKGIERAINEFLAESKKAQVRMIYFAGHGAQFRGTNYFIPVDAKLPLPSEDSLPAAAVNTHDIVKRLSEPAAGVALLILDACNSVPIRLNTRGAPPDRLLPGDVGRLNAVVAPRGTLVAFAASPGQVATDSGVYAKYLAGLMREPGLPIEVLFKSVRIAVMKETGGRQVPFESSTLVGEFCLVAGRDGTCGVKPYRPVNLRELVMSK